MSLPFRAVSSTKRGSARFTPPQRRGYLMLSAWKGYVIASSAKTSEVRFEAFRKDPRIAAVEVAEPPRRHVNISRCVSYHLFAARVGLLKILNASRDVMTTPRSGSGRIRLSAVEERQTNGFFKTLNYDDMTLAIVDLAAYLHTPRSTQPSDKSHPTQLHLPL
ncbi:hypothetical protein FHL15_000488 [Xylaria flabelliformis]|uniref:Uncharacterized protein n=1 Tax=Xylaria flabelliformis TaxID=2512241 RepID=A0A553IDZ1_9PEZI|nr:hypothetical protein FHL15_000488 [Xylaria flabelliformis]